MTVRSPGAGIPSSYGGKRRSGFLILLIEKPPSGGILIDGRQTWCYDPLDSRLRTPQPTRRWGAGPKSENDRIGGNRPRPFRKGSANVEEQC